MKNKTTKPMLDLEKQMTPLKGEVSPENARFKANVFASQVKARMKSKGAKLKQIRLALYSALPWLHQNAWRLQSLKS